MDEQRTFAYLLLACSMSRGIHAEICADWGETGCGDILEIFVSLEGQADVVDTTWAFDWQESMNRIAPVQLTNGWDPRQHLLDVFERTGQLPLYQVGDCDDSDYRPIIFLGRPPSRQILDSSLNLALSEESVGPLDKTRFNEILTATAELAQSKDQGILFIGNWGLDYEFDAVGLTDEAVKNALKLNGMKFVTRHA